MGPTACGKTDLAIRLSQELQADIVSVDSAMIYRGMNIGTAKPSESELKMAPHRLIDLCDPITPYSAGQFCTDALQEIKEIVSRDRTPLLVGGTMLYFHKLLFGLAELPTADAAIRDRISSEAAKIGWGAMHEKLQTIDPVAANKIKPQDPQRIQRALEVFYISGKRISDFHDETQPSLVADYQVISIALIPQNRVWLHERIAKRFEKMLADNFLEEVRHFYERGDLTSDMPSMRIVGYRQAWEYLEGKVDFETMKQKAIAATRQLAKRQMTWLRSWENTIVFDPQDAQLYEKIKAVVS